MITRIYPEGDDRRAREYSADPMSAVLLYCAEQMDAKRFTTNLIAEPVDEECAAVGEWHDDGDGPLFRMFMAQSRVMWMVNSARPGAPSPAPSRPASRERRG